MDNFELVFTLILLCILGVGKRGVKKYAKKIDLVDQKFGRLTVIKQAEHIRTPNGRYHVAWECKCECGNIVIVRGDNLRNGYTVSCGCKKQEILAQAGKNRASNLIDKKFGRLTVKRDSGKRNKQGGIIWECECSCGNITYVSTSNLTRKKEATISCGCAKSRGEEKIISSLIEAQIPFITQKKFNNCIFPATKKHLIFDFYLPEHNLLIEYDGEQHFHPVKNDRYKYEKVVERDNYKNNWCKENNINLIRIPYTEFNNLNAENMRRIIRKNGWTEIF